MRKKMISPSILSADFASLKKEIDAVAEAGADWIHVDVMDGHFVPNITIGVPVVESLKKISKLPLDVHLMIDDPEFYAEKFVQAGADILTVHVEAVKEENLSKLLQNIRGWGVKAGLTLRPKTDLAKVVPYLDQIDLLLIMSVEPGFSGQKFMMEQARKLNEARRLIDTNGYKVLLEIDGGVNMQTIHHCENADVLVAGHAVFKSADYKRAIQELKAGKV